MRQLPMIEPERKIDVMLISLMATFGVAMLIIGNKSIHYVTGICAITIAYLWGWMATHNKP